jgi:hypothetical protein
MMIEQINVGIAQCHSEHIVEESRNLITGKSQRLAVQFKHFTSRSPAHQLTTYNRIAGRDQETQPRWCIRDQPLDQRPNIGRASNKMKIIEDQ